jgi:hypothetical protein
VIVASISVNNNPRDLRALVERCSDFLDGRLEKLGPADVRALCRAIKACEPHLDTFTRRIEVCVPDKDQRLSEEKDTWLVKAAQAELGSELKANRACADKVALALKEFEQKLWPKWRAYLAPPNEASEFNFAAFYVLKLHVRKGVHEAPSYRTVQRALEKSPAFADNDSA